MRPAIRIGFGVTLKAIIGGVRPQQSHAFCVNERLIECKANTMSGRFRQAPEAFIFRSHAIYTDSLASRPDNKTHRRGKLNSSAGFDEVKNGYGNIGT
jgi:hypothetical protein